MPVPYKVHIKLFKISLFLVIFTFFFACGSYQSAYNNEDGIYASENNQKEVVIVETQSSVPSTGFDTNYFSNQLDELGYNDDENEDEIFTDIDDYYYAEDSYNEDGGENYGHWEFATDVTVTFS